NSAARLAVEPMAGVRTRRRPDDPTSFPFVSRAAPCAPCRAFSARMCAERRAIKTAMMSLAKWLAALLVVFGGFTALMYAMQRSLMYFPERQRTPPAAVGLSAAKE